MTPEKVSSIRATPQLKNRLAQWKRQQGIEGSDERAIAALLDYAEAAPKVGALRAFALSVGAAVPDARPEADALADALG